MKKSSPSLPEYNQAIGDTFNLAINVPNITFLSILGATLISIFGNMNRQALVSGLD